MFPTISTIILKFSRESWLDIFVATVSKALGWEKAIVVKLFYHLTLPYLLLIGSRSFPEMAHSVLGIHSSFLLSPFLPSLASQAFLLLTCQGSPCTAFWLLLCPLLLPMQVGEGIKNPSQPVIGVARASHSPMWSVYLKYSLSNIQKSDPPHSWENTERALLVQ